MTSERVMRKPLMCRLGWHQWYIDGAWFNSADKCGRCFTWRDAAKGAKVTAERDAWAAGPEGETFNQGELRVAAVLADRHADA